MAESFPNMSDRMDQILGAVIAHPSQVGYARACREWDALPVRPEGYASCRALVLADFTTTPLVPCLRIEALKRTIDVQVREADFGQIEPFLVNPAHALRDFNPDLVFILLHPPSRFANMTDDAEAGARAVQAWQDSLTGAIRAYSRSGAAPVVLSNLMPFPRSPLGILDAERPGIGNALRAADHALHALAAELPAVHLLDLRGAVERIGLNAGMDPRMAVLARLPFSHEANLAIAREMSRFLWAACGLTRKCAVLDLDNTLWGGIIGEDGPDRIALGDEAPGLAYKQFQRALKGLRQTGVLLAVCSKNTESVVLPILEGHPEMILRPADLAAWRINWRDKAANLRELAAELRIGLNSMVFFDDDPRERERIRQELPEVIVHDLPDDSALFADSLLEACYFDKLAITEEDLHRAEMYEAQKQRSEQEHAAASLADYLRSLDMTVTMDATGDVDFARVHQLIGKTNQFNTTTIRYSEAALRGIMNDPDAGVFHLRLRDRFGDSGLTGVAILRYRGDTGEIDTFLLSCRILGRTVETAFLSFLSRQAIARGCARLVGRFRPTDRNAPAATLYPDHGFTAGPTDAEGGQTWTLDLSARTPIAFPAWIAQGHPGSGRSEEGVPSAAASHPPKNHRRTGA